MTRAFFPAFPEELKTGGQKPGMTLRDYFAAAALQGMLADGLLNPLAAAKKAVEFADALLAELPAPEAPPR